MNRTITRAVVLAFTLLFSLSLLAQVSAVRPRATANPEHPLVSLQDVASTSVPTTTYGGTLVYSFTITMATTIPSTSTIYCTGNADIVDAGTGRIWNESATVVATKGSVHAVCTVRIPYSWAVASATAATDSVSLGYSIMVVPSGGTALGSSRSSIVQWGTITLPANGATTTTSITATI